MGESPQEGAAGALWARGLRGVTDAQLRHGIDACVASGDDWPPSLPKFRALCFDIPTLAAVRAAIYGPMPADLRPFCAMVWDYLDSYRMQRVSADKSDRMIAEAYSLARDAVLRGEPLPELAEHALEPPRQQQRAPASSEVARAALDAMGAALGARTAEPEAIASPATAHEAGEASGVVTATMQPARMSIDKLVAALGQNSKSEVER